MALLLTTPKFAAQAYTFRFVIGPAKAGDANTVTFGQRRIRPLALTWVEFGEPCPCCHRPLGEVRQFVSAEHLTTAHHGTALVLPADFERPTVVDLMADVIGRVWWLRAPTSMRRKVKRDGPAH